MACDFKPYEGSKPYLFISYSHKNKKDVFKILNRMNQDGYRIWYDEGIEWGTEWPTEIANHLVEAQAVLFFHSKDSLASKNCRQEIFYSIKKEKPTLSIYLEEVELDRALDMQLSLTQSTYYFQYLDKEEFFKRLNTTDLLKSSRNLDSLHTNLKDNSHSRKTIREIVTPSKYDFSKLLEEESDRDYQIGRSLFRIGHYGDAEKILSQSFLKKNSMACILLGRIYRMNKDKAIQEKSLKQFDVAIKMGNPLGTAWLAESYFSGLGVKKDLIQMKTIYAPVRKEIESFSSLGSVDAQYFLGHTQLSGSLYTQNFETALYWLEKANNSGEALAGLDLFYIYNQGWGIPEDKEKAFEIIQQYSPSQDEKINLALGEAYLDNLKIEDRFEKAFPCFLQAANLGNSVAQDWLAYLYFNGFGVKQSNYEAITWLKRAAESGLAKSQYNLGYRYHKGMGVDKDPDKAFKYLYLAAEQGKPEAQVQLVSYYFDSNCSAYDPEKGFQFLISAANLEFVEAYTELYKQYWDEYFVKGIEESGEKLAFWTLKGAEAGNKTCQQHLSEICEFFSKKYYSDFFIKGVQKSAEQFVALALKGAEAGNEICQRYLGIAYLDLGNSSILPLDLEKGQQWLLKASQAGDRSAFIRLIKFYSDHKEFSKDIQMEEMFHKAAQLIQEMEKANVDGAGISTAQEHAWLGEAIDTWFSSSFKKSLALDNYCDAFFINDGNSISTLSRIADLHFLSNLKSTHLRYDDSAWIDLIKQACHKDDNDDLEFILGQIYYFGNGVDKNLKNAEMWLNKASDHGSIKAACFLADFYLNTPNYENEAFKLAQKAYQEGSIEGGRLLGLCYDLGYGVKQDRSQAKTLIQEAADKGDERAKYLLENSGTGKKYQGKIGSISWEINREGILTIGPGVWTKLFLLSPWRKYKRIITQIDGRSFLKVDIPTLDIFKKLSQVKSINLSGWNTSSVTDMNSMFYGCSNLKSLDLSNWDTSSVTDMRWMFYGCNNLKSLDLSNWDTSSVTNMSWMFNRCSNLESLDLSNWDTSSVKNMSDLFFGCIKLEKVILNSNCSKIVAQLPGSNNDWYPVSRAKLATFSKETITIGKTVWIRKDRLVQSIKLATYEVFLKSNETFQLVPQIQPREAVMADIHWSSEDPAIAQVDQEGLITGYTPGVVWITGITINDISTKVKVTVSEVKTA